MTNKTKTLLLLAFVIALGAGAAAGVVLSRMPKGNNHPLPIVPGNERSTLAEELQLSPQQSDQMRSIWENVRDKAHDCFEEAQNIQKGRDEALMGLLNDEQKAKFEKISKEYADRFTAMTARREAMFQEAVEKTKKILNPEQTAKYDEILRKRVGGDHHH